MIYHFLASHDQSARTGVPRFSGYFQKAFPDVVNITPRRIPEFTDEDVVVTDNHLSLMIPERVHCVVVHHGCAPYHYEVDEGWRCATTEHMAVAQRLMFHKRGRIFVAPSKWVQDRFSELTTQKHDSVVLPHWVPLIPEAGVVERGLVIGDWRNWNKGAEAIKLIRLAMNGEAEFLQLDFDGDDARRSFYQKADAYLCLSLSEGAPYSVMDAEAAGLPIASTVTGNIEEFSWAHRIKNRENTEEVCEAVRAALENRPKRPESFFVKHSFEEWKKAWQVVIDAARNR